jgi:hypothetical protein
MFRRSQTPAVGRDSMLKYLRIGVTALSLTACVLLIALWVRSYSYWDHIRGSISEHRMLKFNSVSGKLSISHTQFPRWHTWRRYSFALDERQPDQIPPLMRSAKFGFGLKSNQNFLALAMPYWFLVPLTATLVAAPWIGWSKRFSLRTLLIATTLIAVVMGGIVYLAK